MYPYFRLAGHEFSSYWTIFLLAIALAMGMNIIRGKKKNLSTANIILLTAAADLFSLLGAKILYYLENMSALLRNGLRLNGVSFFGSLFLVPLGIYFISKVLKTGKTYLELLDFLSPSLMLVLAMLRIGCFVSGCCGGISLTLAGTYISAFPTQLTECFFDLLIMLGLLLYEKGWKKNGRLYFFIMVYYGILRFILEFVRDTKKDWLYMSHGQWFAIISVIIGGYILHSLEKKERKQRVFRSSRKRRF